MAEVLPLNLMGDNLGKRHECFNSLVNVAFQQNTSLQSVLDLPERNPIDRVFKIELASKHKHAEYIISQLKELDMLFVSKALKSYWLLEAGYSHVINPDNLETNIYPDMTTVAVNKMRNWIELNLNDPERCRQFYEYYESNFDVAIKFLWRCSSEFIVEEVLKILEKLKPKHLKLLCEKCPEVAKVYFNGLPHNKEALRRYLREEKAYCDSIKSVLKQDDDLYLDVAEKHFDGIALSPSATRYIMKNCKHRYHNKPEFYTVSLLDMESLAPFLSSEEIKDIVLRLARADYLGHGWLTYKRVEPLIKCLNSEERTELKKKVFVDKSIGTKIESWPYPVPPSLIIDISYENEPFTDVTHVPEEYERRKFPKRMLKKRKCAKYKICSADAIYCESAKTGLDAIFDRYRFMNFDRAFFELRKQLLIESSVEGRRNIMLVLVSKAGANESKVNQLLQFLAERHTNEPENLRDAIARSLVKRAFAWRLSPAPWELLLKWAKTSIREILHCNILRHLLSNSICPPSLLTSYLNDFSDLTEYSLNAAEKACIAERLPALLISTKSVALLLNTLNTYKRRIETVPGAEAMLITAAREDENILRSLFKSRFARHQLLEESFRVFQTEDSYINALRHDPSVLADGASFVNLISKKKSRHDRFLRTLVLYFYEPDGLGPRHLSALVSAMKEGYDRSFARPLAFLSQVGSTPLLDYISVTDHGSSVQSRFAAALIANSHVSRCFKDIVKTNWQSLGAKYVANAVLVGSDNNVDNYIQLCLKSKKTMRLALLLCLRNKSVMEVFGTVIKHRPTVSLKVGLSYLCKGLVDTDLWHLMKPIIVNLDLSLPARTKLQRRLKNMESLPSCIEAEYYTVIFKALYKISEDTALPILCRLENLMPAIDDTFLKILLMEFLDNKLNRDALVEDTNFNIGKMCMYFRIIAKYLLCNKNHQIMEDKNKIICDPLFDKIEELCNEMDDKSNLHKCVDDFLLALKFSKVFLDTNYVSCIPMFERILQRLQNVWPREQYFVKYVCIHLTMLYCRSIRQAKEKNPHVFQDTKLMRDEGIRLVGFNLGRYIGHEIQELTQSYFKSIIEIYQEGLSKFFADYFIVDNSKVKLVTAVIKGLLEGQDDALLLAEHVYRHEGVLIEDDDKENILQILEGAKSEELQYFLHAHLEAYY